MTLAVSPEVCGTLEASTGGISGKEGRGIVTCMAHGQGGAEITEGYAPTLNCNHEQPIALVGNTINRQPHNGGNGTGFDESGTMYTLTKTDVHAVCLPINTQIATRHEAMGEGTGMGIGEDGSAAYTLQAAHGHAVATLVSNGDAHSGFRDEQGLAIQPGMQVRRLLPIECEKLQGFPPNYTNIPGASDSARYKALGNSMAVNCMALIGQRIQMVDQIQSLREKAAA